MLLYFTTQIYHLSTLSHKSVNSNVNGKVHTTKPLFTNGTVLIFR